jgi:hypothetical protein
VFESTCQRLYVLLLSRLRVLPSRGSIPAVNTQTHLHSDTRAMSVSGVQSNTVELKAQTLSREEIAAWKDRPVHELIQVQAELAAVRL